MNHYGIEIEFHLENKEMLAQYLLDFSSRLDTTFGVDGAGISAEEIRSPVLDSLEEVEIFLASAMAKVRKYKPDYKSTILKWRNHHLFILTHSVHISLDSDENFDWEKINWLFYVKYPLWLLKKSPLSFLRYFIRKLRYPEMAREHPNRMEFRFLSSEFPLQSLQFVREFTKE